MEKGQYRTVKLHDRCSLGAGREWSLPLKDMHGFNASHAAHVQSLVGHVEHGFGSVEEAYSKPRGPQGHARTTYKSLGVASPKLPKAPKGLGGRLRAELQKRTMNELKATTRRYNEEA